ncbi:MAG: 50S ribosomal protein L24 [Candidatus Bathyarchaeota archaeon]
MAKNTAANRNAFSANLSPELAQEYGVHSVPIRKGDTIISMRGSFRDVEGKVTKVDRKNISINVEGIVREKSDGSTKFLPIHPSKVRITKLNLDDSRRKDILGRKASKPIVKTVEAPKTRARKRSLKSPTADVNKSKDEV